MTVGTKSLVCGVHQVVIHPFFVLVAWIWLYGLPNLSELVCIVIHDWGYWGKSNMDGPEGETHPEFGARLARLLLDRRFYLFKNGKLLTVVQRYDYYNLCLLHSRHYSRRYNAMPSRLCWADKLSVAFEPWWLYLPRAILSGEINEYRRLAAGLSESNINNGRCFVPMNSSHRYWYLWLQNRFLKVVKDYHEPRKQQEAG